MYLIAIAILGCVCVVVLMCYKIYTMQAARPYKKCPVCKLQIEKDAPFCKYCKHPFKKR